MAKKAPFGWTVVRRQDGKIVVYKRDCALGEYSTDLAAFTHATKAAAVAAGKRGEYRQY